MEQDTSNFTTLDEEEIYTLRMSEMGEVDRRSPHSVIPEEPKHIPKIPKLK